MANTDTLRSPVHPTRKEIFITQCGILFTLLASALVAWEQGGAISREITNESWGLLAAHGLFLLIAIALIYGGLVYQFTRLGYLQRLRVHRPASRAELDGLFRQDAPALTILVPSYKEERKVVMQTLLSAALQEYPRRRVVLLIDNPPYPTNAADAAQLAEVRELPLHLQGVLERLAAYFGGAQQEFEARLASGEMEVVAETGHLAALWLEAAEWFAAEAMEYPQTDHTDRLYVEKVLALRARSLAAHAAQLRGGALHLAQLQCEYRKLASLFAVEITSFERKRYVNLSHEANKAMNLNSYIGLVGRHFQERQTEAGLMLEEVDAGQAQWSVPQTDYFLTLDADSLLLPEYALRLIHIMEQPGSERIAVAQTPYSAVPGATGVLERIAGATTDIQYIIHQGFTRFGATFWVGANALLRRSALDDIAESDTERGYPIRRFIQDRTVIEDTESSVDLAARGWQLYNYPERLAYSATPPDFGSLIIQRRRWANGGLNILPKLLRYLGSGPDRARKFVEGLFRVHYLVSIAAVNLGLLIVLAFPFSKDVSSFWLPFTALPYFLLYARDLKHCGYEYGDLPRIYALNLLLLPVNLGGVFKSIQQGISGRKIPFGRTPKIQGRTAAAPLYIVASYVLASQWLIGAFMAAHHGYVARTLFAAVNAGFLWYAIVTFIGLRESREDLLAAWRGLPAQAPGAPQLVVNNSTVLLADSEAMPRARMDLARTEAAAEKKFGT